MADVIQFPVRRNERGAICCINNCGGEATCCFELAEMQLLNGEIVPYRAAGRKYFCAVCAPNDAVPITL